MAESESGTILFAFNSNHAQLYHPEFPRYWRVSVTDGRTTRIVFVLQLPSILAAITRL